MLQSPTNAHIGSGPYVIPRYTNTKSHECIDAVHACDAAYLYIKQLYLESIRIWGGKRHRLTVSHRPVLVPRLFYGVWLNTANDHKGPQRSIVQDHRGSPIMKKLPDLQLFCRIFFSKYFMYVFVMLNFFVLFCEFWSFYDIKWNMEVYDGHCFNVSYKRRQCITHRFMQY